MIVWEIDWNHILLKKGKYHNNPPFENFSSVFSPFFACKYIRKVGTPPPWRKFLDPRLRFDMNYYKILDIIGCSFTMRPWSFDTVAKIDQNSLFFVLLERKRLDEKLISCITSPRNDTPIHTKGVGEGGAGGGWSRASPLSKVGAQVGLCPPPPTFGQSKCSNFTICSYFVVKNTIFSKIFLTRFARQLK